MSSRSANRSSSLSRKTRRERAGRAHHRRARPRAPSRRRWFRETFRDSALAGDRGASSAIYYLLRAGEVSRWHRIDAVEVWHWYAGAPLRLLLSRDGVRSETLQLGTNIAGGERPQAVVPVRVWQSAESFGAWTLVGCTVAPAFDFAGFELAPPSWQPG